MRDEPFVEKQYAQLRKAKGQDLCKQCRKFYLIHSQAFCSFHLVLVITYLLEDFNPMSSDWVTLVDFGHLNMPGKVPFRRS